MDDYTYSYIYEIQNGRCCHTRWNMNWWSLVIVIKINNVYMMVHFNQTTGHFDVIVYVYILREMHGKERGFFENVPTHVEHKPMLIVMKRIYTVLHWRYNINSVKRFIDFPIQYSKLISRMLLYSTLICILALNRHIDPCSFSSVCRKKERWAI